MRYLFIHQNMPGQFGHLAAYLAARPDNQVAFVTRRSDRDIPGVLRATYDLRIPPPDPNPLPGVRLKTQAMFGEAVIASCRALLHRGFRPDVIIGHPGWGELLFVKDLFPDVPLVSYCEYFHRPDAPFFMGDPPRSLDFKERLLRRADSAHLLLSLEAADKGWSPTDWQKSGFPKAYRDKIDVIFDGVDTQALCPRDDATFDLPDGRRLKRGDEVLTYVARSLEPSRGFPTFWRALPEILRRRPHAQAVIVGNERAHYDAPPSSGTTWLRRLQQDARVDPERVHLLGWLSRDRLTALFQVSSLHVYLTVPSVLSWSMVEAMSAGCIVLGSKTPPVEEMLVDTRTGFLTDFSDSDDLSRRAAELLYSPPVEVGRRARKFVQERLSLRHCLPRQIDFFNR